MGFCFVMVLGIELRASCTLTIYGVCFERKIRITKTITKLSRYFQREHLSWTKSLRKACFQCWHLSIWELGCLERSGLKRVTQSAELYRVVSTGHLYSGSLKLIERRRRRVFMLPPLNRESWETFDRV